MSDETKDKQFNLFIDGKEYTVDEESVTGAFIKQKGSIPAGYQLFLEEEGDTPDLAISDQETVNLKQGKTKHFFAVPPATFGV